MSIGEYDRVEQTDLCASLRKVSNIRRILNDKKEKRSKVILCRELLTIYFPKGTRSEDISRVRHETYSAMGNLFTDRDFLFPEESIEHMKEQLNFVTSLHSNSHEEEHRLGNLINLIDNLLKIMKSRSLNSVLGTKGLEMATITENNLANFNSKEIFYDNPPPKLVNAVLNVYSTAFSYANRLGDICIVSPRGCFGRLLDFHRSQAKSHRFYPEIEKCWA